MVKPNPGDKPSLLTHSDFFFLILLTISHYAQLFTLFTLRGNEVDTAQCRPHSASQCLAIPEEAGYQPAEQALLLFSRVFFKRTKYKAGVERETRATSEGVCHASVSRPPRSSRKKKRHHLRPANLSVIEHHNLTVQHQGEQSG